MRKKCLPFGLYESERVYIYVCVLVFFGYMKPR